MTYAKSSAEFNLIILQKLVGLKKSLSVNYKISQALTKTYKSYLEASKISDVFNLVDAHIDVLSGLIEAQNFQQGNK
ncbi:MAG: hypothetical protein SFU99_12925 [Saprospiraceae bacterium]|nr:hypothetical protein [Saprospiraceae bacterium]